MVKRWAGSIVLPLSLLVCTVSASADKMADARKAIQAAYNREDRETRWNPAEDIDIVHITATEKRPGGKTRTLTDKQIDKGRLRSLLPVTKSDEAGTTIRQFSLRGKTALVTVLRREKFVMVTPETKQTSVIVIERISKDEWGQSGGTWRSGRKTVVSERTIVDGRPVAPGEKQPGRVDD